MNRPLIPHVPQVYPSAMLEASQPIAPIVPAYQGRAADRKALVDMQRTLFQRTQDPKTPAHIAAQCARAWRDLQDMKRIIDGKPLPGQLRPDLAPKQRRGKPALLSMPELPKESLNPPGGGGGSGGGGPVS